MGNKKSEMYLAIAEALNDIVLPRFDELEDKMHKEIQDVERNLRSEMQSGFRKQGERIDEVVEMLNGDIGASYNDISSVKKNIIKIEREMSKMQLVLKDNGLA